MNYAVAFALISTFLGALYAVIFKLLFTQISFLDIAMIETGFLTFFFGVLEGWRIKDRSRRVIKYLSLGALSHTVGTVCFYLSLQHLMPIEFSFLCRNQAVFAILLGFIFLKERPTPLQWLAMLTALFGSFIFTYSEVQPGTLLGIICAFGLCVAWAFRSMCIKKIPEVSTRTQMFWGLLCSSLSIHGIVFFTRGTIIPRFDIDFFRTCSIVCLTSWVCIGFGISLCFLAMKRGYISFISSIRAISPIFVTFLSSFFFQIEWSMMKVYGAGLCVLSIILFILVGYRAPKKEALQEQSYPLQEDQFLQT